ASVRLSRRVVRWKSLTPSRRSMAFTCLLAIAADMPKWRAAAERLPSLAARTNTRIPVRLSSIQLILLVESHRSYCPVLLHLEPSDTSSSFEYRRTQMSTSSLPTLFVPHGAGPCFFMDWTPADTWTRMAEFLRGIAAGLPQRPRAILLVSGHWLAPHFSVTSGERPELIYDYHGFPAHTYELTYPAPGSPALAQRVMELLGQSGLEARADAERGFDHGVFIPLKL